MTEKQDKGEDRERERERERETGPKEGERWLKLILQYFDVVVVYNSTIIMNDFSKKENCQD